MKQFYEAFHTAVNLCRGAQAPNSRPHPAQLAQNWNSYDAYDKLNQLPSFRKNPVPERVVYADLLCNESAELLIRVLAHFQQKLWMVTSVSQ